MKSVYISAFLILIFSLTFSASNVLAESITTPDKSVRAEIKNEINTQKEVRQEIKAKVKAEGQEIKAKISATRRERIRSFFGRMIVRIEATIDRIKNLISRIETRIATIETGNQDLDTQSALDNIAEAKVSLSSAESELFTLKSMLETTLSSEDPKAELGKIQQSVKKIKDDLRQTHTLLVQSIGDLKGLRGGTNGG